MQVKIGDMVFDPKDCPIMLILTPKDKENVANMLPEATKLCAYPGPEEIGLETEEEIQAWEKQIEEWMEDTEPTSPVMSASEPDKITVGEFVEEVCLDIPTQFTRARPWVIAALRTWEDPPEDLPKRGAARRAWRAAWRRRAIQDYEQRVGNPMIWMWILGMAFNALFQWWLHRRRTFEMAREDLMSLDGSEFNDVSDS